MEEKFKEGDLVKLKIWGEVPLRVVEYHVNHTGAVLSAVTGRGQGKSEKTTIVVCEWYDENHDRHQRNFEQDMLEPYDK